VAKDFLDSFLANHWSYVLKGIHICTWICSYIWTYVHTLNMNICLSNMATFVKFTKFSTSLKLTFKNTLTSKFFLVGNEMRYLKRNIQIYELLEMCFLIHNTFRRNAQAYPNLAVNLVITRSNSWAIIELHWAPAHTMHCTERNNGVGAVQCTAAAAAAQTRSIFFFPRSSVSSSFVCLSACLACQYWSEQIALNRFWGYGRGRRTRNQQRPTVQKGKPLKVSSP
jgi:hypothetical protein